VLRLYAIVSERSNDFELQRPELWNQNIGNSLRPYSWISITAPLSKMLRDELRELRLAVGSDAKPELFKRDAAAINGENSTCDVIN